MPFRQRSLNELASMVCGDAEHFLYRSSSRITDFFADCGTNYVHDGSTRARWVAVRLGELINGPRPDANTPPPVFPLLIRYMMDLADAQVGDPKREAALKALNRTLARERFEAFYADDGNCYVRQDRPLPSKWQIRIGRLLLQNWNGVTDCRPT